MAKYTQDHAERYNALDVDKHNAWWSTVLGPHVKSALDIGAGTGRDARWISKHCENADVFVVEPSPAFQSYLTTPLSLIHDQLPDLKRLSAGATRFDLILLNAVFMHVAPNQRRRVFRKLTNLLRPGGSLVISTKIEYPELERDQYEVASGELRKLAIEQGLQVVHESQSSDSTRAGLIWEQCIFRLPDDGSGALATLRHIAVNDSKSSTYKLGLLRVLNRLASEVPGCSRNEEERVFLPAGLVALYWLRLYLPLMQANIPQSPSHVGGAGKLAFMSDKDFEDHLTRPLNLSLGSKLSSEEAKRLKRILTKVVNNNRDMPVNYIRIDDRPVIRWHSSDVASGFKNGQITLESLRSFGEFSLPFNLWNTLKIFDLWLEPLLLSQWEAMSQNYLLTQRRTAIDSEVWQSAFTQADAPIRSTGLVRDRIDELSWDKCVWTNTSLRGKFDVDHALPFAHWPCNQFWNLVPSTPQANRSKSDRIPTHRLLSQSKQRLGDWWKAGYTDDEAWSDRFWTEAQAGLPMLADSQDLNDLFEALCLQSNRLRTDYAINGWSGQRLT